MPATEEFDVVIIGGGSGLTAAYHAERDGKSVALVDAQPDALGGTCVNRGCLPTKGLIQSAQVMKTVREAEAMGIHLDQSSVRADFAGIMRSVREARAKRARGVRSWVDGSFTPFYGRAKFVDDKVIEMDDGRRLTGERIFITTGARPAVPPIAGLDGAGYLTNEGVLELDQQPERLLILGGGYIGCEFAHFFATLGTRVTVVDREGCLLREDQDVRSLFTEELGRKVELLLNTSVSEARRSGNEVSLTIESAAESRQLTADAVLVATGRRPNTDGLGLDATGVETDEHGWITTDDQFRTTHPDIFAYGDVIGREMFKHTSSYEGEIAYANSQGGDRRASYHANPHAIFSDPEVAAVGLTEAQCEQRGLRYKVAKKNYAKFAKGEIVGSPPGFAKLIVEEETDRILGFHLVGPHAADLIHEVVVAMNAEGGRADLIRRSIHVHPALPELIQSVFASV